MATVTDAAALAVKREQIDSVDARIVELLAERAAIVRQLPALKRGQTAIRCPEREEQVIRRIRTQARHEDLDPDTAERIYRAVIAAMTDLQANLLAQAPETRR